MYKNYLVVQSSYSAMWHVINYMNLGTDVMMRLHANRMRREESKNERKAKHRQSMSGGMMTPTPTPKPSASPFSDAGSELQPVKEVEEEPEEPGSPFLVD